MQKLLTLAFLLAVVFAAATSYAQCSVSGTLTAAPNPDPNGPVWVYTLVATWDSGNNYGLSHIDFFIDAPDGTCSCAELEAAITLPAPAGVSDGDPAPCTVPYLGTFECFGDPSIPFEDGKLIKFEPVEDTCEPGPTGTATIEFMSDYPPVPIHEPCICIVDKAGLNSCMGIVTGSFPGLPCDPISGEEADWGAVKVMFTR